MAIFTRDIFLNELREWSTSVLGDRNLLQMRVGSKFCTIATCPGIGDFPHPDSPDFTGIHPEFIQLAYFGEKSGDYIPVTPGTQIELHQDQIYFKIVNLRVGIQGLLHSVLNGRIRILFHDFQEEIRSRVPDRGEWWQFVANTNRGDWDYSLPSGEWTNIGIIAPCFPNIKIGFCSDRSPGLPPIVAPGSGSVSVNIDRVRLYPLIIRRPMKDGEIAIIYEPANHLLIANEYLYHEKTFDGFSSIVQFDNMPKGLYFVQAYSNAGQGEPPVNCVFSSSY